MNDSNTDEGKRLSGLDWVHRELDELAKLKRKRKEKRKQEKLLDLDRLNELKSQIDDGREPTESDAPPDGLDTYTASFDFDVDTARLPAVLERSDGETILYAGKLNSVHGIPGSGKSWVAIIAADAAVSRGGNVLFWDHEDSAATFKRRSLMIGFDPSVHSESFKFVSPSLIESDTAMFEAQAWLSSAADPVQSLVVIDSAEASGCPSDGRDVNPWLAKYVNPWRDIGAGVLVVDHVPKRADESGQRPRGGIGSQRKLAAVDGAALAVSGVPWTKRNNGRLILTNHKDRGGDLIASAGKQLAVIRGTYRDGAFHYDIISPEAQDDSEDLSIDILIAVAELGQDGVTGQKERLGLVKGKTAKVETTFKDLTDSGMLEKRKVGRSDNYRITDLGRMLLDTED